MGTEILKSFEILQEELERAKDTLKGVDENIKRLIGRDPNDGPTRPGAARVAVGPPEDFRGRPVVRRWVGEDHGNGEQLLVKRQRDGFYNRSCFPDESARLILDQESPDEEEYSTRPAVPSRVIATPRDTKSRQEVLAAQSADSQSKARNRRMFGALLGTLQKFQQEETRMRDKEEKRARVEKKLEEAARREREELRRERQELFLDRKRKQAEIRKIELKILRIKEQDEWEAKHRYLLNFIQTKAKPHIFYLPKIPCARSEERLLASQKAVARMIEKKREDVHAELGAIEKRAQWRQGLVEASEESRRGWANNQGGMSGSVRGVAARRGRKRLRQSVGIRAQVLEAKEEGEVGEDDDEFDGTLDDEFEGIDDDDDDDEILGTIPSVASTVIRPRAGEVSPVVVEVQRQPVEEHVEDTIPISSKATSSPADVVVSTEKAAEEVAVSSDVEKSKACSKSEVKEGVVETDNGEKDSKSTELKESQHVEEDFQPMYD